MQYSQNSGVEELIKSFFVRGIESDCCCSISKQLASPLLSVGPHRFVCWIRQTKIFTYPFLPNLSASIVERVICRQNSELYGVLMQVKSISECSNTFEIRPILSYHLSLRPLFCLFLSGRFTQVLQYYHIAICWVLSIYQVINRKMPWQ